MFYANAIYFNYSLRKNTLSLIINQLFEQINKLIIV